MSVASTGGGRAGERPAAERRSGRTKRSKTTAAETGFPGTPKTSVCARHGEENRLPGLDRDLVEDRLCSESGKNLRNEIEVPLRDTAGRQEKVESGGECSSDRDAQGSRVVGSRSEVLRLGAGARERAEEQRSVRVPDLGGTGARAGADDLRARDEDAGSQRTSHGDHVAPRGGREDEVGGGETASRRKEGRAGREDFSLSADVIPGVGGRPERHGAVRVLLGLLDRNDGIGAGRDRGSRHHLHRARGRKGSGGHARAEGPGDPEPRRRRSRLGGAHGPAVHRRRRKRREVEVGHDRLGEDAPRGGRDGNAHGAGRRYRLEHALERLLEGDHVGIVARGGR